MRIKSLIVFVLSLVMSNSSFAGSVSGGGGTTVNPNPSSKDEVAHAVGVHSMGRSAAQAAIGWFNRMEIVFDNPWLGDHSIPQDVQRRMLKGEVNPVEVLKNLKIELEWDQPCHDLFGNEVDGSIHPRGEADICISAFSIAPKVNRHNVFEEVTALLIHEVVHLIGIHSEEEADAIQVRALDFLHWGQPFARQMEATAQHQWSQFELWTRSFEWYTISRQRSRFNELHRDYFERQKRFFDGNLYFSPISSKVYQKLIAAKLRHKRFSNLLCSVDPDESQSVREMCREEEDSLFGEQTSLTAEEIQCQGCSRTWPLLSEEIIERPTSIEHLNQEAQKTLAYLEELKTEIEELDRLIPDIVVRRNSK